MNCPACHRDHEELKSCPLCERAWNQAVLGALGVFDGLPIPPEKDPEENTCATYVACGCGFHGPSRDTCRGAVIAWNQNVNLILLRLGQGTAIDRNKVLTSFKERGWVDQSAEAA